MPKPIVAYVPLTNHDVSDSLRTSKLAVQKYHPKTFSALPQEVNVRKMLTITAQRLYKRLKKPVIVDTIFLAYPHKKGYPGGLSPAFLSSNSVEEIGLTYTGCPRGKYGYAICFYDNGDSRYFEESVEIFTLNYRPQNLKNSESPILTNILFHAVSGVNQKIPISELSGRKRVCVIGPCVQKMSQELTRYFPSPLFPTMATKQKQRRRPNYSYKRISGHSQQTKNRNKNKLPHLRTPGSRSSHATRNPLSISRIVSITPIISGGQLKRTGGFR